MANYKQILTSYYGNPDVDTLPTATSKPGWIRHDKDNAGVVKSWVSDGTNWIEPAQTIPDGAITNSKLATDSINAIKIQDGIVTNAKIFSGAAISFSKINSTGAIVNADVNASAAVAYSKLNLSSSIVNADISGSAAITDSKLAQITDKAKLPSTIFYENTNSKMKDVFSPIIAPAGRGRKYGSLSGFVTTPMTGIGIAITAATGQAGGSSQVPTATLGRYITHTTGAVSGDNAGGHASVLYMRSHNPYFAIRFRHNQTTNCRGWFGWTSDGANSPTGDTYADSKSVFLFGWRSTDTNYQIIYNDGTATAPTPIDTGVALSTAVRTVELYGDDAGTRFGYSINGAAISYVTSTIPATGTNLGVVWEVETAEAVAKTFDLIAVYTEFDSK